MNLITGTKELYRLVGVFRSGITPKGKPPKSTIRFKDDSFLSAREWFLEFAEKY